MAVRGPELAEGRVFPFVDSAACVGQAGDGGEDVQQDLELRIGSWAVSVRQLQRMGGR